MTKPPESLSSLADQLDMIADDVRAGRADNLKRSKGISSRLRGIAKELRVQTTVTVTYNPHRLTSTAGDLDGHMTTLKLEDLPSEPMRDLK